MVRLLDTLCVVPAVAHQPLTRRPVGRRKRPSKRRRKRRETGGGTTRGTREQEASEATSQEQRRESKFNSSNEMLMNDATEFLSNAPTDEQIRVDALCICIAAASRFRPRRALHSRGSDTDRLSGFCRCHRFGRQPLDRTSPHKFPGALLELAGSMPFQTRCAPTRVAQSPPRRRILRSRHCSRRAHRESQAPQNVREEWNNHGQRAV
jgi:hypothetical protein